MPDWLLLAGLSLAAAVVVMTVTAVVSARVGRLSVVDVAWGLALLLVAVVCAAFAGTGRSWLLVALVAVWALRLSGHIFTRSRGHGEDPRYVGMSARNVFVVQGAAVWLVSLPLQAAALSSVEWSWVVWVGVAVWAVGVLFETVADAQLTAYKRDPDRSPVLDTGLWSWSRHPNYFGEFGFWVALALFGLATSPSDWWVVVGAVAMLALFEGASIPMMEERSLARRPGYQDVIDRVPRFVPRPPRRA